MAEDDHILVTVPDRYFGDALTILLVDLQPDMLERVASMLSGTPKKLAIHAYEASDDNPRWLIDVANQASIILMNMGVPTQADPYKGYLLPRTNAYYYGRQDIATVFQNYTDDPVGKIIVAVGEKLSHTEEK